MAKISRGQGMRCFNIKRVFVTGAGVNVDILVFSAFAGFVGFMVHPEGVGVTT